MKFNGRFVLGIIDFAGQQGADVKDLTRMTGGSIQQLSGEEFTVEGDRYINIIDTAVKMTGDTLLGLHYGEYSNLSAHGILLQIMQTSSTIKEALRYVCEFSNLGCSSMPLSLEEKNDKVILKLTPHPIWMKKSPETAQQTADGIIAFTLREIKTLLRQKETPSVMVRYGFPKPVNYMELERVFEGPVSFGHEETAIIMESKDVEKPVVTSDKELLEILVSHASRKLKEAEDEKGFTETVKRSLLNLVKPEFPSIGQVANNLNVSVRTLQRKLKDEGQTFKILTEDLKHDLAVSYLSRSVLSISEISYMLSYSDPSAFIRSFKKRAGKTPQGFRESLSK